MFEKELHDIYGKKANIKKMVDVLSKIQDMGYRIIDNEGDLEVYYTGMNDPSIIIWCGDGEWSCYPAKIKTDANNNCFKVGTNDVPVYTKQINDKNINGSFKEFIDLLQDEISELTKNLLKAKKLNYELKKEKMENDFV